METRVKSKAKGVWNMVALWIKTDTLYRTREPEIWSRYVPHPTTRHISHNQSGRSENEVSYLAYFRFLSSHTTVHAVRHTAVSCLLSTLDSAYWTSSLLLYCRDTPYRLEKRVPLRTSDYKSFLLHRLSCEIMHDSALRLDQPRGRLLRPLLTPRHSLLLSLRTAEVSRDKPYIFPRLPA